jgi:hypothetical protein
VAAAETLSQVATLPFQEETSAIDAFQRFGQIQPTTAPF